MPYAYLEDVAPADIAFRARHVSLGGLFVAAADATINVMVEQLDSIRPDISRQIVLENDSLEMLLYGLLEELIYYKDAEQLLLRVQEVSFEEVDGRHVLYADAKGEILDLGRHRARVDVKAVTLHDFSLSHTTAGWEATVVLDV